MQLTNSSFLICKIKKMVSENDILQAQDFCGIEGSNQNLGQLCLEALLVTGPVVNSQLAANLAGQCFGLEAISNQETFKDAFRMIRRIIIEV